MKVIFIVNAPTKARVIVLPANANASQALKVLVAHVKLALMTATVMASALVLSSPILDT
jgi:hypothetical protein